MRTLYTMEWQIHQWHHPKTVEGNRPKRGIHGEKTRKRADRSPDGYALGMTAPPLARDIDWLHSRLDEAASAEVLSDVALVGAAAARMTETGTPDESLRGLSLDRIDGILKLLTIRFHLRPQVM